MLKVIELYDFEVMLHAFQELPHCYAHTADEEIEF